MSVEMVFCSCRAACGGASWEVCTVDTDGSHPVPEDGSAPESRSAFVESACFGLS